MIQATSEELQKLIDEALEKNIALEIDESRSVDEISEPREESLDSDEQETNDYDREADDGQPSEQTDSESLDLSLIHI